MHDIRNSGGDDALLVERTLHGDNEAFDRLMLRHERAVYAAAYAILKNHHLAQDIAQDAFMTAWRKLDTLEEPAKFVPWVHNIAQNRAKDHLRKQRHTHSSGRASMPTTAAIRFWATMCWGRAICP